MPSSEQTSAQLMIISHGTTLQARSHIAGRICQPPLQLHWITHACLYCPDLPKIRKACCLMDVDT